MEFVYNILNVLRIILISSTLLFGCKKEDTKVNLPELSTSEVTEVTYNSANCGGRFISGKSTVITCGTCWSTSEMPTVAGNKTTDNISDSGFSSSIKGLSANTTYYIRAYATNSAGTSYGEQRVFTTLNEPVIPTVSTAAISSVTSTSAVSGGNVTSDGGLSVTARGICWSVSPNPTTADNKTVDGSDTGAFVSNFAGLMPGTNYYVRAYATNSKGTAYGNQVAFSSTASVVYRYIDFESSSFTADYNLVNKGVTYLFITKGAVGVNYYNPVLTTVEKYRGCTSIKYEMPRTTKGIPTVGVTNDKSQHRIFGGSESLALDFGQVRYFGFAVKIDPSMDQPTDACQMFQIWQGSPMSPPLSFDVAPGGSGSTYNIWIHVRNNTTKANPSAGLYPYTGSIQSGVWYTFVLMVVMRKADDTQDGEIILWQNGNQLVHWYGRVGYGANIEYGGTIYQPNAKFDAFFGPYRGCQQSTVKMYFDEVRYAADYTGANPGTSSPSCP